MSDDAESSDAAAPRRTATIGELLAESTDFSEFLKKRREVDVIDADPNPVEILEAERRAAREALRQFRPKS